MSILASLCANVLFLECNNIVLVVVLQDGRATGSVSSSRYQKTPSLVRPLLIPTEDELEKQEGFFGSLGKLLVTAGTTAMDIVGGIFPGLKRKPVADRYQHQGHYQQPNTWASQESFEIPKEEEPPSIETRAPTPKKTYAFMSKDAEKMQQQLRQSREFYCGWAGEFQQQQQQQQQLKQKHQQRLQHHSAIPQTYFEQSSEKTNEIIFGAVQEGRPQSVIKPTDHAMAGLFNHQNIRPRSGHTRQFSSYT